MGDISWAKRLTKTVCLSERQIEALEEDDRALYFTLAVSQLFFKCGNCGMRENCNINRLKLLKERSDLEFDVEEVSETIGKVIDFLEDKLSEEDFLKLIELLKGEIDLELEDVIEAMNSAFGECDEYNVSGNRIEIGGETDEDG